MKENISYETLINLLEYNPGTGLFIWKESRGKAKKGSIAGTTDKDGYILIMINSKQYKAHRLAWLYCFQEWPSSMIDHINRVASDNRLDNLREATSLDNQRNRSLHKNSTTGFPGVSLNKRTGRYEAYITVHGIKKGLGHYNLLMDAVNARVAMSKQEFGDFSSD